jgi:hypothetical protein
MHNYVSCLVQRTTYHLYYRQHPTRSDKKYVVELNNYSYMSSKLKYEVKKKRCISSTLSVC